MTAPTAAQREDRLDARLVRLISVLVLGAIMALMDATIVNVGVENLSTAFGSDLAVIQWVPTAYLLAVTVAIPVAGWAMDRFGGRTVWLGAVALFLVGSLACGFAWSAGSLIVFRVLQGLGGGMIEPVVQAMVAKAAGPKRIGRAMSVMNVPLMLAPVIGPVLGGVIIDKLSWPWLFFINVPIGLVALAIALRVVPRDQPSGAQQGKLDLLGVVLLPPGFAALVYGFSQAGERGGFSATPVLIALVLGVLLLAAYVVHALKTTAVPLVDLRLFATKAFSVGSVIMFVVGVMLFGTLFLLPLYYQQVQGANALQAGLMMAPQGLGGVIGMALVSRVVDRASPRLLVVAGLVVIGVSTVVFSQVTASSSGWWLGGWLFVRGLGLSLVVAPAMTAMFRMVAPSAVSRASSALYVLNQLGGSIGIALLSVLLLSNQRSAVPDGRTVAADPSVAPALASAYGNTFWLVLGANVLAVLAALLLPGASRGGTEEQDEPVPEDQRSPAAQPVSGRD